MFAIAFICFFISIMVGMAVIRHEKEVEEYMFSIPSGDLCYHEPNHTPVAVYVIFPIAFVMFKAYVLVCRIANAIVG